MELNQLLEGSNNYKSVQADAARLADKWTQSGLLEGYTNEIEKNNMAMILENQAKQIVSEQSNTGAGGSVSAGTGEQWAGVALPLVRKVFAQISAKDFVSVQPMNLPSGLVFYLDFKYGDSRNGRAANDNLYGNVTEGATKMAADTDPSGGLYGAGQFGYTINSSSVSNFMAAAGAANSASVSYEDGVLPSAYFTIVKNFSGLNADLKGVRAFRLISASVDITGQPELTSVSGETVSFLINTGSHDVNDSDSYTVVYHQQPTDNDRGDFEAGSSRAVDTSIVIPEIDVTLASEAIVAKTSGEV